MTNVDTTSSAGQPASVCTLLWINLQAGNADCNLGITLSERFPIRFCRRAESLSDLIADVHPNVICFDYDQPDMSGLRLLRDTKLAYPSLPILMLSDPPSAELALWALRTRVWDYFIKPVTTGEIERRINILDRVIYAQRDRRSRSVFFPQHLLPVNHEVVYSDAPQEAAAIAMALEHLHRNYASKITLADAAQACGLGQYEFSRQFRRIHGVTFRDYIIRYRLDTAAAMLHDTGMDVLAIAMASGFNDASHFSRTFRRHYGLTPTAYRFENRLCGAVNSGVAASDTGGAHDRRVGAGNGAPAVLSPRDGGSGSDDRLVVSATV